jgi:hypothetical protein
MLMPGAPPGIKFALGENVTRKNSGGGGGGQAAAPRRYPASRMGQAEVLRDAFVRAREYQRTLAEHRAKVARGERNLVAPRRDLELDRWCRCSRAPATCTRTAIGPTRC